ncbi:hypothetical protein B0T14DRAFT_437698, partial [Immersiella caudata]
AIEINRAIGVSYIWIDALCIVQDDDDDKTTQLIMMDLIYSMAICLISASASPSALAGCFYDHLPNQDHRFNPFTLTAAVDKVTSVAVLI